MTLKYSDLEEFCAKLLDKLEGKRDIGLHTLKHEVVKRFGFSDYKVKNIMKALYEYGFIERKGVADRFKITYLQEQKNEKKCADKEAKEILDNLEKSIINQNKDML